MLNCKLLVFILFAIIGVCRASLFDELISRDNSAANLEKSFTATCAEEADTDGYCTYSLLFQVLNGNLTGTARILVNGLAQVVNLNVQPPNIVFITNFNLQKDDNVVIEFDANSQLSTSTNFAYAVANATNPEGYFTQVQAQSMTLNGQFVLISDQSPINLINFCPGDCTYTISKLSQNWNNNTYIQVYINNIMQDGNFFGTPYPYDVKKGDAIQYRLIGTNPGLSAQTADTTNTNAPKVVSKWYIKLYYTPAGIPNTCQKSSIGMTSPFGGPLQLLTSEEANLLTREKAVFSLWYWLTGGYEE